MKTSGKANAPKSVPYSEIPAGRLFKVLKEETRRKCWLDVQGKQGLRTIKNDGVYLKIGNSHARDWATSKDCIFPLSMPCRLLELVPNQQFVELLPDWEMLRECCEIMVEARGNNRVASVYKPREMVVH